MPDNTGLGVSSFRCSASLTELNIKSSLSETRSSNALAVLPTACSYCWRAKKKKKKKPEQSATRLAVKTRVNSSSRGESLKSSLRPVPLLSPQYDKCSCCYCCLCSARDGRNIVWELRRGLQCHWPAKRRGQHDKRPASCQARAAPAQRNHPNYKMNSSLSLDFNRLRMQP